MIISAGETEIDLVKLGRNVKTSITAEFNRKDLSGQTSSSATSSAGNKPKKINVSIQINTDQPENLTKLLNLAEALDGENPIVCDIVDPMCKAMKIRQVIFTDSIKSQEDENLQVYNVNFVLQESNSVAEKREEREKANAVPKTPPADGEITVGSVDHAKIVETANAN